MSFLESLSDPVKVVEVSSEAPLEFVKDHVDNVIKLSKQSGLRNKFDLEEVTISGLDANQVWWQAKIVQDSIEGELLDRIQELREVLGAGEASDVSGEESEEQVSEDEEDDEDGSETEPLEQDQAVEQELSEEEDVESDNGEIEGTDLSDKEEQEAEVSEGDEVIAESRHDKSDEEVIPESKQTESEVNDQFFNIDEFNKQTDDSKDPLAPKVEDDDEDDIDYFGDIPSEDDEEAIYYDDFFDKPDAKSSRKLNRNDKEAENDESEDEFMDEPNLEDDDYYNEAMDSAKLDLFADAEDESEEDGENDEEKLSTFEKRQLELKKQIEQLEKEAIAEKKWALKGEVKAQDRPDDTLLTEELEFDRTAKPVPIITQEVTESLEEMIRRRIKEYNFDDLQRRTVADLNLGMRREKFELSDAKSSKSLAEIYEEDYKGVSEETAASEELQKEHDEISDMLTNLFYKLDALSSSHFVPRPAKQSLEVKVESAAIAMEDAQPLTMTTASTLAPQEVYKVGKAEKDTEIRLKDGTVMSKEELSREDKTRLRRAAKRKRSKALQNKSQQPQKKSKKSDVIDTLSKAKNVTVIDNKGQKSDVGGKALKDKKSQQADFIKL